MSRLINSKPSRQACILRFAASLTGRGTRADNTDMTWDASEHDFMSHDHRDFVIHKWRVQELLRSRKALSDATVDLKHAFELHCLLSIAETGHAAAASPPLDLYRQLACHSSIV